MSTPADDIRAAWPVISMDLRRARALVDLPHDVISLVEDFLDHNELELAHDALMQGVPANAPFQFWQHLARAAARMGIAPLYPPQHTPFTRAGRFQAVLRKTMQVSAEYLQPERQQQEAPASIVASEIATRSERGPAGTWSERVFRAAYVPAHMAALMIVEICSAIDVLLDLPVLLCWPHEILARSTIEAHGLILWLMEADLTPRARVVRSLLLRWAGAAAQERTLKEMDQLDQASLYGSTRASLRSECLALGIAVPTGKGFGSVLFECEGERLTGFTARAKAALGKGDASVYSLYSLVAHAQVSGLWRGFTPGTFAGQQFAGSTPDDRANWTAIRVATGSLLQAVHQIALVYGWDRDTLDDWIDEYDRQAAAIEAEINTVTKPS